MMLPKNRRLTTEMFKKVFSDGERFSSSYLNLHLLPTEAETPSRFAAVVPKKVAGSAVGRNRIKRQVYAALEEHIGRVEDGYHGIFFAGPKAADADTDVLAKDVERILDKAEIYPARRG